LLFQMQNIHALCMYVIICLRSVAHEVAIRNKCNDVIALQPNEMAPAAAETCETSLAHDATHAVDSLGSIANQGGCYYIATTIRLIKHTCLPYISFICSQRVLWREKFSTRSSWAPYHLNPGRSTST
jgi:hypothetical protein